VYNYILNGRLTMGSAISHVSSPFYLIAAYGRRYPTAEAAICAWKEGKDFQIIGGPYCSIRDLEKMKDENPSGIYLVCSENVIRIY